jgi:hypothetical protein
MTVTSIGWGAKHTVGDNGGGTPVLQRRGEEADLPKEIRKRGHCSVGAVHGGESDDPILALMRYHNLPVTRQDYLNVAYLGHPPEELSAEEEADLPKAVRQA